MSNTVRVSEAKQPITDHQDNHTNEPHQDGEEEEEFLLHLKFDHGSYPLRHNLSEIHLLGIHNGSLFIRIGNAYFMGEYDKRNSSSILFSYDKQHQAIYENQKCRSKIFMKRVLLKPKEIADQQSQSEN